MDFQNSPVIQDISNNIIPSNFYESVPTIQDASINNILSANRYATVYKVKLNSEFVYIYVQFNDQFPKFEQFIAAIRQQCAIPDDAEVIIKDDKECKIPNDTIFGHFIRYIYNPDSFFVATSSTPAKNDVPEIAQPVTTDLPPIYEDPDKFFIHFLSKDLINYFKNQTQIICKPTGGHLIQKYHIGKELNLEEPHKKSIIQISANHLMLIKNKDPTTHDRTLWAKVICEVFPQFRDVSAGADNYLAVYNPAKGDGFLGNRIKLLKKAAKRVITNQTIIDQLNSGTTVETVETEQRVDETSYADEAQQLVEFLKTADISKDIATIKDCHKKTFTIRQHYRRCKDLGKLISEFPRFFDVDGLIDEDFSQLYPLSGLVTFTQEIQQKILSSAKGSKNYVKFPITHKNLAEPIDALLHLIILLPPQSLGRGCKNRVRIEDAFPRLVKIHEVNQPLSDVAINSDGSAFIVVSGLPESYYKLYYVAFDNRLIKCESAIRAIDILMKVHYVFDAKFETNVRHVLSFLAYYFYNIKNSDPTSQMRFLNTQLTS